MLAKYRLVLASIAAATLLPASAAIEIHVSGEARQEVNTQEFVDRYKLLSGYIGASVGTEARLVIGRDPAREIQKMRAGLYEVVVGPAHVIGAAIRYGYDPVARFGGEERAVFVASKASAITSLEGAKGKRLALPPAESLATYLARGELNAKGVVAKQHFAEIKEHRYHEVALLALQLGQADVAVADAKLARDWIAKNGGTLILETRAVPGIGIAMNAKLDRALKERLRQAFLSPNARPTATVRLPAEFDLARVKPIELADYEYVSTLGYFTPRQLPGATVATADQVTALLAKGAVLYDTRTKEEYAARRIRGARFLPYVEKSAKEVGFDEKLDSFDLAQLAKDRNAAVIFACNGAECWKSYKAAHLAARAGYKEVFWFRGGFPEWNLAGLPTETSGPLASSAN